MIAAVGTGALLVALVAVAVVVTFAARLWFDPDQPGVQLVKRAGLVAFVATVVAFGALEWALLADDFSIRYVAEHHARSTGFIFSIATAWAALEGSILLWAVILTGYLAAVTRGFRGRPALGQDRLGAGALVFIGGVALFFLGALVSVADPFQTLPVTPADGPGPNPLLQDNILMAVHPPLLYLGYVGLTVPYGFAMSALATREHGPSWVLRTQRWTVLSWSFLTAGIVLGAWWSYEVLGWGGYWAWDPVENASIMPWLAATAYLHSAIIQARRNVLKAWSIGLIIAAFALTLIGTFLTRSGIIASVHSFSQSEIGPVLLTFIVIVVVGSLGLFVWRADDFRSGSRLQSLASREGAFLVNNLLLSVLTLTILLGTLYPIFYEAVTGNQISVGRPYFDRVSVPLSLLLLLTMATGPLLANGRASWSQLWERAQGPMRVGLGFAALTVVLGQRSAFVIVVVALAATVIAAVVRDYISEVSERADELSPMAATRATLTARPGFWGGQLTHIGIVLIAVGIATSGQLAERGSAELELGETVTVAGYDLTFLERIEREEPARTVRGVRMQAERNGASTVVEPRLHFYQSQGQALGVPAVSTSGRGEDLYITIASSDLTVLRINVIRYPFIALIWLGGMVAAAGGFASLGLRRLRLRGSPAEPLPTEPESQRTEA